MSYKIKNTGGVLNIGQLMDFDGETVDIATNKAAIQAVWKDGDGNAKGGIVIAENPGDNYDCLMTVHGTDITGVIAQTAWRTPYNTSVFTVGNISNFRVGDTVETQVDMVIEQMTVTDIDTDNGTITVLRGDEPVALADSLMLVIARSGAHTVAAYDDDDTEIEVDDVTPYAIGMVVEALLTGEHLTITDIDGNVLTVTRDVSPDSISIGEMLVPYGLEDEIAAGNSWDDYSTRTSFSVVDASIFNIGDTIQAAGSDEVMTVTQVDTANDVLTVVRGTVPEDLADDDVLTITNRWNNLPLGTHTIRLSSATDAIIPRNIVINVVSEAAYQQMFNNSDWQRKENTMITANGFYVRSAAAAIAARLINNDLRTVADIAGEEMVAGDDTADFTDTLLAVSAKDAAANGFYVELPTWLPPGIYEVEIYEEAAPTDSSTMAYSQMIDVRK